jgi:hypothetical protein
MVLNKRKSEGKKDRDDGMRGYKFKNYGSGLPAVTA